MADRKILTEAAAQSAAAEKNGPASPDPADTGFLPVMECSPRHFNLAGRTAVTQGFPAVSTAEAGAEGAALIEGFI